MNKYIGIGIVILAVAIGVGSRFVFKKSDNVIEEIAEKIIKDNTGHDIDLSPDTKE